MKTKTRNEWMLLVGLMLAWAGTASAELTVSWTGERQGVARAAIAGESEPTEPKDAEEADEENAPLTQEEYLATVAWVEGEAAVDELSRRMVDGLLGPSDDGEGSRYGESTLPGGAVDKALPDGVQVTRRGTGTSGTGSFSATDSAENYASGDWGLQTDKGAGFGDWQEKKVPSDMTVTRMVDGGFYMKAGADEGEVSMIRNLVNAQGEAISLESGQFTVRAWGEADEPGDFLGFAVYGSSDGGAGSELFRWGVRLAPIEGMDDPVSAFMYSTDGGNSYEFITDGYPGSGVVDYSLTWAQLGGKTGFTLSATDGGTGGSLFNETVELQTTAYVMAIAAVLTESGVETAGGVDGSEMTFDNLSVTGVERAVPEPGVMGLLAAGAAALFRRKAKRGKGSGRGRVGERLLSIAVDCNRSRRAVKG